MRLSEDRWRARLYSGEQNSLADYRRDAGRLRSAMGAHVVDLLRLGVSDVLDLPASTPAARAWMRSLFEAASCDHRLHHLDAPDHVCNARLDRRAREGGYEFTVGDADFALFTSFFVAPTAREGFDVVVHRP